MTSGPYHILFFIFNILIGSFYLINLMLAVVAMSYEEEAEAMNVVSRGKSHGKVIDSTMYLIFGGSSKHVPHVHSYHLHTALVVTKTQVSI